MKLALLIVFFLTAVVSADELTTAIVSKQYDKDDAKKVVSLVESQAKPCWRLVHDGVKVLALFESGGITWTKHNMYCATLKTECEAIIKKLGLIPLPEEEEPLP